VAVIVDIVDFEAACVIVESYGGEVIGAWGRDRGPFVVVQAGADQDDRADGAVISVVKSGVCYPPVLGGLRVIKAVNVRFLQQDEVVVPVCIGVDEVFLRRS